MVRRRECRAMAVALGEMEGVWVEMEVVLKHGLQDLKSGMEMVGPFLISFSVLFLLLLFSFCRVLIDFLGQYVVKCGCLDVWNILCVFEFDNFGTCGY